MKCAAASTGWRVYMGHIAKHVKNSDLLLCEGMFTRDLAEDAYEKKHMTSTQAAMIARDSDSKKLGLIHYSPRYTDKELQILKEEACEVFENTVLCKDRYSFVLNNPDYKIKPSIRSSGYFQLTL